MRRSRPASPREHDENRRRQPPSSSSSAKGPIGARSNRHGKVGSRFNPIENFPHLHRPCVLNPKSPSLTRRNSAISTAIYRSRRRDQDTELPTSRSRAKPSSASGGSCEEQEVIPPASASLSVTPNPSQFPRLA
jgi:hypothetical protein